MNKEETEELRKKIEKLYTKKQEVVVKVRNSSEYQKLDIKYCAILKIRREIDSEIYAIKKKVTEKYLTRYSMYRGVRFEDIKSSVKQGIKIGLKVKNTVDIGDNIVRVVKYLIERDKKKGGIYEKEKVKNIKYTEYSKIRNKKDVLILDKTGVIEKQIKAIENKINAERIARDKIVQERRIEAQGKINTLDDYIEDIDKEINKRLILDGLN